MKKPILCLDFDGVCHSYTSGWKGAAVIPDPPVTGLFEFLVDAEECFDLQVFSSRSNQDGGIHAMTEWFAMAYMEWHNAGFGPCGYLYNGRTQCGYKRNGCMHVGTNSSTVPIAGRHEYIPTEKPIKVDLEDARRAVGTLITFPLEKPAAFIGLDDRVLLFEGQWPTVEIMKAFKPWYLR